jgi:hypothetical protein
VEVWPPQRKKPRRTLTIGLACAAAVIAIIAGVAAVALTMHTHAVGSAPAASPKSSAPSSSAPAAIPGIDTLLLGPAEVDQVMGTSDMLSDGPIVTKLFESTKYSPYECRGVVSSGSRCSLITPDSPPCANKTSRAPARL